jgi:uncharacterized protein
MPVAPRAPASPTPASFVARTQQGDGWTLELLVSQDRLCADVRLVKTVPEATCAPEEVVKFLEQARVVAAGGAAGLRAVAERVVRSPGTSVSAARGVPPKPSGTAIDWLIPLGIDHLVDDREVAVDLHEVVRFINVRASQKLCELVTTPGAPGRDVFGAPLTPPAASAPLKLGARVAYAEDGRTIIATQGGCIRYEADTLSVEQVYDLKGDLDFKTGNIDFHGKVVIHGSVADGFRINATEDVLIEGMVGASTIEAGGDLVIKGGVAGLHKAHLSAGGQLQARYLHQAIATAGGNVLLEVECHDSVVVAGGDVTVRRGGIIGGDVQARGAISAGFIGSEMCPATNVAAGHDSELAASTAKVRQSLLDSRDRVRDLQHKLGPWLDSAAAPPPARREQVTALHAQLAEARETAARWARELLEAAAAAPRQSVAIKTQKEVFGNVLVSIGSVCVTRMPAEVLGPVTLTADYDHATIAVHSPRLDK